MLRKTFAVVALTVMVATRQSPASAVAAQTARDICGAAPVQPLQSEPPAKLVIDPPLADPLKLGRVVIQYRTENLQTVPVFGGRTARDHAHLENRKSSGVKVSPPIARLLYFRKRRELYFHPSQWVDVVYDAQK